MYQIQQQKHIYEETSQKAQYGCWNSMINWYKRDYFEGQQLKLLQAVDYFKCDWRLSQLFTRCCYLTDFATCRHLPPVWRSFVLLLLDRKKIRISLVWELQSKPIMGPGSDAKILLPDILHDLCCTVSSTCRRTKITLFNHRRLYHSWWFSRWWGVESNSMEASRSYNLYNRLLQLVTCRANDNQDDESDKWWW